MGTAFIFFSGQIQGALLLLLSEAFETDLTPEAKDTSVKIIRFEISNRKDICKILFIA